jgi:hypothetical protein
MKFPGRCRISRRPGPVRLGLTIAVLGLSNALGIAQQDKASKSAAAAKPTATEKPKGSPKASPTPDTKIDPKLEAELLQAEDRFIIAIQNGDAKALDELLHPYYADSFQGGETAVSKRGVMARLNGRRLPAYRMDRERKLTRSGDSFTVEGMAVDAARGDSDDRPNKWVHVVRLWMKEGDRWIATGQTVTPEEEWDEQQRREAEAKDKKSQ